MHDQEVRRYQRAGTVAAMVLNTTRTKRFSKVWEWRDIFPIEDSEDARLERELLEMLDDDDIAPAAEPKVIAELGKKLTPPNGSTG